MIDDLTRFMNRPALFTIGTDMFWDDEHISKELLKAHLNPDIAAASRKPSFLDKSVEWIAQKVPPKKHTKLLDLGCGPGLYAERFARAGYSVTGIDFSNRSIAYAKEQTSKNKSGIEYHYQDYLTIDYVDEFDVITLIYCDYGALSTENRRILLSKMHRALKPNGKLILDVFTPVLYIGKEEKSSWQYNGDGGFWSEKPHICLEAVYHYDKDSTELRQCIVITKETVNCYNIWEHFFTKEMLLSELQAADFIQFEICGNVAGENFSENGDTICGVFTK